MSKEIEVLEETKGEFEETLETMMENFPEKLAAIKELEETKEELKKIQEELKDEAPEVIETATETFHIRKKLQFVLNDLQVHKQVDAAIEFIDEQIIYWENK